MQHVVPECWKATLVDMHHRRIESSGHVFDHPAAPAGEAMAMGLCKAVEDLLSSNEDVETWYYEFWNKIAWAKASGPKGWLENKFIVLQDDTNQIGVFDHLNPKYHKSETTFISVGKKYMKLRESGPRNTVLQTSISKVWLSSDKAEKYDEFAFNPNNGASWRDDTRETFYKNLYNAPHKALAIAPARFTDAKFAVWLLLGNFPDEGDREILLSFMHGCSIHPGELLKWAVMFQGTPGCGKGLLKQILNYCCSHNRKYVANIKVNVLKDGWTSAVRNKVLAIMDEVGDCNAGMLRELAPIMKELITEDHITHNIKHSNAQDDEPNFCNVFVTTNEDSATALIADGAEDRRWAYLSSQLQKRSQIPNAFSVDWVKQNHPEIYSQAVLAGKAETGLNIYFYWLENMDGYETWRYILQEHVPVYVQSSEPKTSSRLAGIEVGGEAWQRAIEVAVAEQWVGFSGQFISMNAVNDLVTNKVIKWLPDAAEVGKYLSKNGYKKVRPTTDSREAARSRTARHEVGSKFSLYYKNSRLSELTPKRIMMAYNEAQKDEHSYDNEVM